MNNQFYLYNNDILSYCVIENVLFHIESCDVIKFTLILPILLNDNVVEALNSNSENIEFGHFCQKHSALFLPISNYYKLLLPVTVNVFEILYYSDFITFRDKQIAFKNDDYIEKNIFSLSTRLDKILNAVPILVKMFKSTESKDLINSLNVKL